MWWDFFKYKLADADPASLPSLKSIKMTLANSVAFRGFAAVLAGDVLLLDPGSGQRVVGLAAAAFAGAGLMDSGNPSLEFLFTDLAPF
jgi:hypothetical protein